MLSIPTMHAPCWTEFDAVIVVYWKTKTELHEEERVVYRVASAIANSLHTSDLAYSMRWVTISFRCSTTGYTVCVLYGDRHEWKHEWNAGGAEQKKWGMQNNHKVIPTSNLHRLELLDRDFLRRYTENHLLTVNFRMLVSIVPVLSSSL